MKKKVFCLLPILFLTFLSTPSFGVWADALQVLEYQTLQINFWACDVMSDGVTVIAGLAEDAGDWGAIFKSTDEGLNWEKKYNIPGVVGDVRCVFADSRDYVFVSGYYGDVNLGGLYRSTDGGESYSLVFRDPVESGVEVLPDGITEDDEGNLYLGTYYSSYLSAPKIYKSTDSGSNWILLYTFQEGHVHSLKYNPHNGWMYCSVGDPGHSGYGFYRSKNKGATWNKLNILSDYNIMGIGFFENYVYVTRHLSDGQVYRIGDDGSSSPPATEVWMSNCETQNWVRTYGGNWLLSGGEGPTHYQTNMKIGGSSTPPHDSVSWGTICEGGTTGGHYGFASASHKTSRNRWLFVSNTIEGKGARIRTPTHKQIVVGGVYVALNKFSLFTPYIGLMSLLAAAAGALAFSRHKRKKP